MVKAIDNIYKKRKAFIFGALYGQKKKGIISKAVTYVKDRVRSLSSNRL